MAAPSNILIVDTNKLQIHYHKQFISDTERTINSLKKVEYNSDEDSKVLLFGKWIKIPRKQVAFGDPGVKYKFAGVEVSAETWPDFIKAMKTQIEQYMINQGMITEEQRKITPINYALLNYYADGTQYIGAHCDDEKDLRPINGETFIASVSFGASRDFIFQRKDNIKIKYEMTLNDGDLLIMRGDTNTYWKHSLPKRLRVKDPRWNLTFRFMY